MFNIPALRHFVGLAMTFGLALTARQTCRAQSDFTYEQEPISYSSAAVDDPVARLQKRLDAGEARLKYDDRHGYLKSVLALLEVPESSQMLVFSKTSFQRDRISPA